MSNIQAGLKYIYNDGGVEVTVLDAPGCYVDSGVDVELQDLETYEIIHVSVEEFEANYSLAV